MPIVKFLGHVLPNKALKISTVAPPIQWTNGPYDLEGTFSISITDSVVEVTCQLNRYSPDMFMTMFARTFDLARLSVDLIAFSNGVGLSVVLDEFIGPDGKSSHIIPKSDYLEPLCKAFDVDKDWSPELHQIWAEAVNSPPLRAALNDLISGIIYPHYGPRVTAQAMETLRGLISPPGMEKKPSWQYMRDMLQLDESYTRYVYDNGKGGRHGDRSFVAREVSVEMAARGWTMMNRYFEYVKRGRTQLPRAEFPLLT